MSKLDINDFKVSLDQEIPSPDLSEALKALWHQAKGDWKKAHQLVRAGSNEDGKWVHAYLHRVQGNESRAGSLYRHAERSAPSVPLEQEWEEIVSVLLNRR